ncbi:MAG TPA: hypothetical protein VE620_14660 [Myxococcales bacterium]|nr:hypothetical protein [Myxococcales bacterium]
MHVLRAAGTFVVLLSALHLCVAVAIAVAIAWFESGNRASSSRAEA